MEEFVLIALVAVAGWVLGILGFFQALAAKRQVADLRRALAAGQPITAAPDSTAAYRAALGGAAAADLPGTETPAAAPPTPPLPPGARPSPFGPRPDAAAVPNLAAAAPPGDAGGPPPLPPGPPAPPPREPRIDIEALLTLRWGVWLGSAALLLAGVFLVGYAMEQGWLGPEVRCVLGGLLGIALLTGAEFLRRRPSPVLAGALAADQAPPALAAGGAAVLFGAAYAAGVLYALVPPSVGFVLMAAAALVGIVASLRFGPLAGLVGVAAGFGTPALVETATPFAPGLFAYLLFVTAAACVVVRFSAWAWLGWIATVAGAGWVLLAATGELGAEYWAPGLFVPAAAALHLLLLPQAALGHVVGRRLAWVPMLALGLAGVGLSGEVDDAAVRAGVLLLTPLALAKGAREPILDRLPWLSALLFLLLLLVWALPAWQPTGEAIAIEGVVQALLPGAWAPQVVQPLLLTAAFVAGGYALAGLWLERWAARPVRWAGLAATVPVVTLGVTYLQVARFQPDGLWALAGAALAGLHVGAAALAMGAGAPRRAGAHAAGAVAALAFGCGVLLHDQWMTLAIALMLPPLAWIAERTGPAALRRVALAVATLVLVRLLLNWYVLDYGYGATPLLNGLWLAYGVPAACFWLAARLFRRVRDDLVVQVLEAGALAFATVLVALQIRHWANAGALGAAGNALEAGLHVSALGAQALGGLFLARRAGRIVLDWGWRVQGALALAGGALLLLANPASANAAASHAGLLFAYLVPAALAAVALAQAETRALRGPLGGYALLAGFAWLTLVVRLLYHPDERLGQAAVLDAEMWSWSGAWLAYGGALMAAGIRLRARLLRLVALAVIGLVAGKAFLLDMAELGGLWRVLSFLGLGLTLIGLGAVFRRFVAAPRGALPAEPAPPEPPGEAPLSPPPDLPPEGPPGPGTPAAPR